MDDLPTAMFVYSIARTCIDQINMLACLAANYKQLVVGSYVETGN